MKNLALLFIISGCLFAFACNKDKPSERFKFLTGPVWTTDSLLANGADASGPGQLLEPFKGDAKFKEDGTGYFGIHTGQWSFFSEETEIKITTDLPVFGSIIIPILCDIVELTSLSLKITTVVPNLANPQEPHKIRLTFKAR
ncbi:MAG: hypothetical protein MUO72_07880 [Bacteroidales bacterium]|nr:hypothetical protein [Bacteroidales bacterium]